MNNSTTTATNPNLRPIHNVQAAANRYITPNAKPGQSYVDSVLFVGNKAKSGAKYKRVHPETFYVKAQGKGK